MEIAFDSAKDRANIAKHGCSLADAEYLEWDTLAAEPDTRADYGEARMVGYAIRNQRLYCVVYTDRSYIRRIISLRKANAREVADYAKHH